MLKTCIICLRDANTDCGIEVCPSRSEHCATGFDTVNRSACAKDTTSLTVGPGEPVFTEHGQTIIVPSLLEWEIMMHNSFSPWTS